MTGEEFELDEIGVEEDRQVQGVCLHCLFREYVFAVVTGVGIGCGLFGSILFGIALESKTGVVSRLLDITD